MTRNTKALERLLPMVKQIASKWEDRQRMEEEAGLTVSDSLTEQYIMEEAVVVISKDIVANAEKKIGELLGR